jgi:hypothetical protein
LTPRALDAMFGASCAILAQLVEQRIRNAQVRSSSLLDGLPSKGIAHGNPLLPIRTITSIASLASLLSAHGSREIGYIVTSNSIFALVTR